MVLLYLCKCIEIFKTFLQVADVLILLHPLSELDEYADKLLSIIIAHALPTTIHIVQVIKYNFILS